MLKKLEAVHFPKTVPEACKLLKDHGGKFVVLAGGTHLGVMEDASITGLVDLKQTKLSYIRPGKKDIRIGAMTPVQDIAKAVGLTGPSGRLLRQAAAAIGSTLLRNAITIGGNIVAVFPWSDLPPVLLALDADIVIQDGKKERVVPAADWFQPNAKTLLKSGEIVTEIRVPEYGNETGTAFHKFAKTKNDYAIISVAVRISHDKDRIRVARVAVNAVSRRPQRCQASEKILIGEKPSSDLLAKAADASLRDLVMTADIRASKEYRTEVLPVFVRRCLEEALK
jgi:CO/xanthine dehydrogenase FAD-binding subunit